jgi:hypothetical protein
MKTVTKLGAMLAACVLSLAATAADPAKVVVNGADIEKFTDLASNTENREKIWKLFESEAATGLKAAFGKLVPGGTLELTFTDLDRAGDVHTPYNRGNENVRYFKDIYPPRAEFSYVIKGRDGAVLLEGKTKLRDLNFQMNTNPARKADTFYYEVTMLRHWVEGDLATALAGKNG